jgi:MFS family permease
VGAYRAVLSVPGSARLMSSALLGRLPQGMSLLAILLLIRSTHHTYASAGVAVGALAVATAGCAPVMGRLVDRYGRAPVLAPMALIQACLYVALVVAANARAAGVILILLSMLIGASLPPIAAVVRGLLREVYADPPVRETAYSLDAVTQELVWIVGPLVVVAVDAATSASGAVVMLGVVCVIGTTLFLRAPLVRHAASRRPPVRPASPIVSPELRRLLAPVALSGVAMGAIEVGLPSLALHAGSRPASGLLLALWSIGSVIGGLWYGTHAWSSSLTSRQLSLLTCAVLLTAPLIALRSIPGGAVGAVLAGLAMAPLLSCQFALVGHAVPEGSETEAFTWLQAALIGGLSAGTALAGVAIGHVGVGAPFGIACAAFAVAAMSAARLTRKVRTIV